MQENDVVIKDVYNAETKNLEHKMTDITNLATNTTLTAKIKQVLLTNLATATTINAKQNKLKTKYLVLLT